MEKVEQNDNVNRDELILQQQREIEKEVCNGKISFNLQNHRSR